MHVRYASLGRPLGSVTSGLRATKGTSQPSKSKQAEGSSRWHRALRRKGLGLPWGGEGGQALSRAEREDRDAGRRQLREAWEPKAELAIQASEEGARPGS